MMSENMWYDMRFAYYINLACGVKAYIAIGGSHAAGYFKTDGQNYCVSTFYVKDNKCYTGDVRLGWSVADVFKNVETISQTFANYTAADFEKGFADCYSWQKSIDDKTVKEIEINETQKQTAAAVEKQIAANPENELLIKILAIAKTKPQNCYCTESELKFKEIAKMIIESKPELA
jgi:hypothetical protein